MPLKKKKKKKEKKEEEAAAAAAAAATTTTTTTTTTSPVPSEIRISDSRIRVVQGRMFGPCDLRLSCT